MDRIGLVPEKRGLKYRATFIPRFREPPILAKPPSPLAASREPSLRAFIRQDWLAVGSPNQ